MKVSLVSYTKDPLGTMEHAAANCYDSEPTSTGRITESCIRSGHTAIAEFGEFVFHVEGVSRSLLAQLTRHRIASYAVRSQRYCDESQFEYVTPKSIKEKGREAVRKYDKAMRQIALCYKELLDLDIPKEDARYVLPNACCTSLDVKFNFRSLMNFCGLRMCSRAQWEIRELANAMAKLVEQVIDLPIYGEPKLSKYLVPKCEQQKVPFCTESQCCGRHKKLDEVIKEDELEGKSQEKE